MPDAIPISAAAGYQLWADTWDDTPSPIAALENRALLPWLDSETPRCAVDVGCGTGRWTARLSAIGVDASPAMLAVAARKEGLHGRLAVGEATALPVATGSADLVLCALTFGHIRDQAGAFREFARVLHSGGVLILSDFTRRPRLRAGGAHFGTRARYTNSRTIRTPCRNSAKWRAN
ncbi:MAG: class I SAM-dependent methyltransferase [Ignavibacteriota bacterium]